MIINKWKSDGRDAVSEDYNEFDPITQVYGVCFTKKRKSFDYKR